ncbi:T9SS type B sorting domain-containing protein [Lutibacter sp.]|uniref:Ig-like domain-containing protein n=1 Tax=Lutibacter sp. TaxID=1925666 RepID=UPI002736C509|nr:T9SS type B sorting domain-containing protein [Lutibacter sp.]MDP3313786.1 T9SS type B sorting domain-containing protein [Lutibacter sp.]
MLFKKYILLLTLLTFFFLGPKSWSQLNITVNGDQTYCPTTELKVVQSFNILDPSNTAIFEISIQISTGYVQGEDVLIFKNPTSHPNITLVPFSVSQGKLILKWSGTPATNYSDLIAAVNDVVYKSNGLNPSGVRLFSITIGSAISYLPLTDHYYEYVQNIGITWNAAKIAAENRTYFGLKGYLATITTAQEAQLSGEQAAGAGWIGGSDAETEGVWKWVTGPETGTIFWNGGIGGSTPNFAFWNSNEPNNLGDEDYAHVTAPGVGIRGSWNDLTNNGSTSGDYQPKGYIVEYGGTIGDPVINISGSSKITNPKINSYTENTVCASGRVTLTATPSIGTIVWFSNLTGGAPLFSGNTFTTPIINSTTTYYALASVNGCLSGSRTPITAMVTIPPTITSVSNKTICESGSAILTAQASNGTIFWYANAIGGTPLGSGLSFTTPTLSITTTYYVEAVINGCVSTTRTAVIATVQKTNAPTTVNPIQVFCEGENASIQQITINGSNIIWYASANGGTALNSSEKLKTGTTYYASQTVAGCESIVRLPVQIIINPSPIFKVNSSAFLCKNIGEVLLTTFNALENYTYQWFNQTNTLIGTQPFLTVTNGGTFTVIATNSLNCKSVPKQITVSESEIALLTSNLVSINTDSENNIVTILNGNTLGIGDYEFSIDNPLNYQDEPVFNNVFPGEHIIYVNDKNKCGATSLKFSVLGFPKFFTPNNDGFNDFWQIKGLSSSYNAISPLYIFNRFGKLIATQDLTSKGWNGVFNGVELPSDDYWYTVQLEDSDGNAKVYTGHFSLIRR